jgi:hypothetical protein
MAPALNVQFTTWHCDHVVCKAAAGKPGRRELPRQRPDFGLDAAIGADDL